MPIKPENRHRYPAELAGNSRSDPGKGRAPLRAMRVPNRAYRLHGSDVWTRDRGVVDGWALDGERVTRVVLTIAHTDHMPENCHPTNLRALCQRCHLAYDAAHHAKTAYQTRRRGRALGDLFDAHL